MAVATPPQSPSIVDIETEAGTLEAGLDDGAATQSPSPSIAGLEAEAGMPQAEIDDEGAAAIATVVALAAKIEVARGGLEPQSSDQGSESVASSMSQHIYDPLAAALGASATTHSAIVEDVLPASVETTAMREPSRLGDALRSHYPEMCLLLMAVALIGAWAYASTPRTPESGPFPPLPRSGPRRPLPARAAPAA